MKENSSPPTPGKQNREFVINATLYVNQKPSHQIGMKLSLFYTLAYSQDKTHTGSRRRCDEFHPAFVREIYQLRQTGACA